MGASMTSSDDILARRALFMGKVANGVMCFAGIIAAFLSGADAFFIDGLYSGVNFVAAFIASHIGLAVAKPRDQRYPFGYDAYESLYVTFRSLILLGILVFALFMALEKVAVFLKGGVLSPILMGPVLVYSLSMVLLCFALSAVYRTYYVKSGRQNEILLTESKASMIDGVVSAGAGAGFFGISMLKGSTFENIIPISDAIIMIIMIILIAPQPFKMFLAALNQVAGRRASLELHNDYINLLKPILLQEGFQLVELVISKLGRSDFLVFYVDCGEAVEASRIDKLRHRLSDGAIAKNIFSRVEVVLTGEPRLSE